MKYDLIIEAANYTGTKMGAYAGVLVNEYGQQACHVSNGLDNTNPDNSIVHAINHTFKNFTFKSTDLISIYVPSNQVMDALCNFTTDRIQKLIKNDPIWLELETNMLKHTFVIHLGRHVDDALNQTAYQIMTDTLLEHIHTNKPDLFKLLIAKDYKEQHGHK